MLRNGELDEWIDGWVDEYSDWTNIDSSFVRTYVYAVCVCVCLRSL